VLSLEEDDSHGWFRVVCPLHYHTGPQCRDGTCVVEQNGKLSCLYSPCGDCPSGATCKSVPDEFNKNKPIPYCACPQGYGITRPSVSRVALPPSLQPASHSSQIDMPWAKRRSPIRFAPT
ncbi:unnamed protein product, partial [Closterium sp. Naga37s-1]